MANEKVTILTRGGLGNIVVTHAKLVEHGRKPYAQYKSAPFVKYVKKGCSKPTGAIFAYDPYLVILAGWQDISSQEIFRAPTLSSTGATVSQGKFASCDSGWQKEFESENEFQNVIADYRGVNSHEIL
jgi:hypothetical protein